MRHHLMEEPYAVIPHVRICAGYLAGNAEKCGQCAEIYGDPPCYEYISNPSHRLGFVLPWFCSSACVSFRVAFELMHSQEGIEKLLYNRLVFIGQAFDLLEALDQFAVRKPRRSNFCSSSLHQIIGRHA